MLNGKSNAWYFLHELVVYGLTISMENNLILKIALGVFLGMAAWTYRADLGLFFIYGIVLLIGALILYWCYQLISNPIKLNAKEKEIELLTAELLSLDLIASQTVGALSLGLISAFSDDDFRSIAHYLEEYKKNKRNGESGEYYKSQIATITKEIIEDFKQTTRT